MKTYRISALSRALLTMWRTWSIVLPVILVNALIQAVISAVPYSPTALAWNIIATVLSALVVLCALVLLIAGALNAVDGKKSWRAALELLNKNWLKLSLWIALITLVAAAGFALWTVPGIIVLALVPFALFAVLEGKPRPLRVNFLVIKKRFWRWLVTALILSLIAVIATTIYGFTLFFLRGVLGASIIWFVLGLGLSWALTAWALIYRKG